MSLNCQSLNFPEPDCSSERTAAFEPLSSILPLPFAAEVPAQSFILGLDLSMRHAGARRVYLRVESVGAHDAPCVWVAGGISADRHAAAHALDPRAGWWNDVIGRERSIDPRRWRVLACDWIGAEGDIDAPIDTVDQADAIALALDALGIAQLHAFVGASYGGMVALQFAARHPTRVSRLAVLSAADRPHPFASAFRALQRQIVTLGQLQCSETLGLSLARQLAMLSYRTPQEFGARFDAAPTLDGDRARCAAEDYLAHCGSRYVAKWSATAFLRLSESIDLHAVDPASVQVPCALFSVEQDWLAPPEQIDALSGALPRALGVTRIASEFGHDAFLKETTRVGEFLRDVLDVEIKP